MSDAARRLLLDAAAQAVAFLDSLPTRPAGATAGIPALRRRLQAPLPEAASDPSAVLRQFVLDIDDGLVASAGPRYFGYVIGGATPASIAADWLTSAWDQNAQTSATSPAASVVEEVVAHWLIHLLGLPPGASAGFVTGGQMANFTALAVARDALLSQAGWDVAARGLRHAPELRVLLSQQAHATVRNAFHMLGLGEDQLVSLSADAQGRLELPALEAALSAAPGPVIVSAQAGNVNTGAFEDFAAIRRLLHGRPAWLHIDGAFGLWAAASPRLRHLAAGHHEADSWAVDAHKWLNVPYDSGLVFLRRPADHRRLKNARCSYSGPESSEFRDGSTWAPENSRRARAFVLYVALRTLGRAGVAGLIERGVDLAQSFARRLQTLPGFTVLNEVVLNQVLFTYTPTHPHDPADVHHQLAQSIQKEGRCWLGPTLWRGHPALRLSISNWSTDESSLDALLDSLSTYASSL